MPTDTPGGLVPLTVNQVHHWATCWTIERKDGEAFHFTDHNEPVSLGEVTFLPAGGFSASAREKKGGLHTRNLEVTGVLSHDAITHDDLRAGKFREARVTERLIDWRYPWAGEFLVNLYWIAEVQYTEDTWVAQMVGITKWLRHEVGQVITRQCRHDLGHGICGQGVDLEAITESGEVTSIVQARAKFLTDVSEEDNYFKDGLLTWTSGNNSGAQVEVAKSIETDGQVNLRLPTAYEIEVGDTFDVYPGCNKNFSQCRDKFDNAINFGGYRHIPGTNRMISTP